MMKIYLITFIILNFWLVSCTQNINADSQVESIRINQLKPGDVQHDTLTKAQLGKIKYLSKVFEEVSQQTYEEWIDNFKRDVHPDAEIDVWEEIATAYLAYTDKNVLTQPQKEDIFEVLLMRSMMPAEKVLQQLTPENITKEEAISAMNGCRQKEKPLTIKER